MCASELFKRDWWRILFLTFDSFSDLGGNQAEEESLVSLRILVGKERKERERGQCKWPQKRESHVCDQMSPNVMGQSRERISDIRKDIRPDNRSDKIIIYSDQFSGLILHYIFLSWPAADC